MAMIGILVLLGIVSALQFQAPASLGMAKKLTDYDAFHIAGTLALEGRPADAYRMRTMLAAQREHAGTQSFMPWTYPPPFGLVTAALAALPIGLGFLLFMLASLGLYLHVLRRIAGPCLPGVLIVIAPTLVLLMRTGQNGFLTGGLIGLFLLAFLKRKPMAGLPLGLMLIKPHIAVGVALVTLMERRWQTVIVAAATVLALLLLSTWMLGLSVWQGFADGVAEATVFLRLGLYPLFRMTSIYAFAYRMGAGPDWALALHGIVALAALAAFVRLWILGTAPNRLAAAICCASLFISPYNYDYDLTLFGLAVAFVLPEILQRTTPPEQAGLVALCWIATGYGLALAIIWPDSVQSSISGLQASNRIWSLMAPLLIVTIALGARILARGPLAAREAGPQPQAIRAA